MGYRFRDIGRRRTSHRLLSWGIGLLAIMLCNTAYAQEHTDTLQIDTLTKTVKQVKEKVKSNTEKKPRFFSSISISGDLVGPVMMAIGSDWNQLEASVRFGIYDRFFPIVELGWGSAKKEGRDIANVYKVSSPYFRIGCDYNFIKKKGTGYRAMGGIRYGFSSYLYDFYSTEPFTDPVWGDTQELNLTNMSGNTHWVEVVFTLEAKIWKFFHLGWDMRFKGRFANSYSSYGEPWYTPGFGTNPETLGWGGTFKIIFEL